MNIALIGMMGSGKTTIGKMLQAKLSEFSFVDTDEEIVKLEQKTINDIFEEKGEAYFRTLETNILREIFKNDKQIISTGGGIVCKEENLQLLKGNSLVIYLRAADKTLYNRIKNSTERPLLKSNNMQEKIISLLKQREAMYEKAHFIIDTDNKSIEEAEKEIIGIINDCCKS